MLGIGNGIVKSKSWTSLSCPLRPWTLQEPKMDTHFRRSFESRLSMYILF